MNLIAFDIETEALPAAELHEPEFKPNANTKDPEKQEAQIAEKRRKWQDKLALDATTAKVLAWGYLTDDGGGGVEMEHGENEKQLITNLFAEINQRPDYWWVGHNIFGFDLPFLMRRAWKHGIAVPYNIQKLGSYGMQRSCFIDTLWWWSQPSKPEHVSLDALGKFLGVGEKNGSGKYFAQTYREDKQAALDYLANDLKLTLAVAQKMNVMGEKAA